MGGYYTGITGATNMMTDAEVTKLEVWANYQRANSQAAEVALNIIAELRRIEQLHAELCDLGAEELTKASIKISEATEVLELAARKLDEASHVGAGDFIREFLAK